MVVDDEIEILELLTVRLNASGYLVKTYADPTEALESLKTSKPDLIVLDMMMPKIDGIEFLKSLKLNAETSEIPVLMLTAKAQTHFMFEAQKLGAKDYILKPFEAIELLEAIKKLL